MNILTLSLEKVPESTGGLALRKKFEILEELLYWELKKPRYLVKYEKQLVRELIEYLSSFPKTQQILREIYVC